MPPYFSDWVPLLTEQSALDATSDAVAVNVTSAQYVMITWGRGTTAGEVTVECSDENNFDGQWAELASYRWRGENRKDQFERKGSCGFIRTRITKEITGGTVTTKLQADV